MNSTATPDRYEKLDAARWLAAMAVVLLHCAAPSLGEDQMYGSAEWMVANAYDSAMRWCVPVFVMISGALLLDPRREQSTRTFYARRMTRIVVPLLFWSVFYLLWRMGAARADGDSAAWDVWLGMLVEGNPYYHLWYLYMLAGLYLFAPILREACARSSVHARQWAVVVILGVAILASLHRFLTGMPHGFFLTWFLPFTGYFIAGRLIFEGALPISRPVLWLCGSIAATAIGTYILSSPAGLNGYFYDNFSLTVPIMAVAAFALILNGPTLPRLSGIVPLTFGIYLVHPTVIDFALRTGVYQPGTGALWTIPVLACCVFLISAGLAWLLQQTRLTARLI